MKPRKIEEEKTEMSENLPPVHIMLRYISRTGVTNAQANVWSIPETDAQVSAWVDKGYELKNTHYIGENTEGFGLVFILVKKV